VAEFKHIFEHFTTPIGNGEKKDKKKEEDKKVGEGKDAFTKTTEQHQEEEKKERQMSKKQRKLMMRMKVFDLKMKVRRPDLVESWDITAKDPQFLMDMKMVRNSVPVPRHWSQKRRYL